MICAPICHEFNVYAVRSLIHGYVLGFILDSLTRSQTDNYSNSAWSRLNVDESRMASLLTSRPLEDTAIQHVIQQLEEVLQCSIWYDVLRTRVLRTLVAASEGFA